jgi:hypothetical protein
MPHKVPNCVFVLSGIWSKSDKVAQVVRWRRATALASTMDTDLGRKVSGRGAADGAGQVQEVHDNDQLSRSQVN